MKIKKLSLGFIGVAAVVLLFSVAVMRAPSGSQAMAKMCQIDPMQCVIPQNLSGFPMRPW